MNDIKILNKIKNIVSKEKTSKEFTLDEINEILNNTSSSGANLNEITYFTCMKVLSESVGKLKLKLYRATDDGNEKVNNHQVYNILKLRPNPYMTPSIFWATVEFNRNHYGNAYVWSRWHGSKLLDLWILDPKSVKPLIDNAGILGKENAIYYIYTDPQTSKKYKFSEKEILHFKTSVSNDGLTGLAVQDILHTSVEGNRDSQKFMNTLYKSGLTAKAVLEYTGDLNEKARKLLIEGFENFSSGADNAGKIIPVPLGMKLTPLNIKLTDSQFFELKKYSALQIAGAFGVKPNHINNYEKSSYSNSEMQNLSFYIDTLLFIITQYDEEITYKLLSSDEKNQGLYFEFNVNAILRADHKTQMETLASGVNNGIYSPNDARNYLGIPRKEGGDILMVNGNYIPITDVGKQYSKGGENNE